MKSKMRDSVQSSYYSRICLSRICISRKFFYVGNFCGNGGLMRLKPHSFDRVDRPLLEFFCFARDSKLPISGALLLEKARIYAF